MRLNAPTSLLCLLLAGLTATGGCSSNGDGGGGFVAKAIAINIDAPLTNELRKGVVKVSGSVAPDAGVTNIEVVAKVKGVEIGRVKGNAFAFDWKTEDKDAAGKQLFKDGKLCVQISATGSEGATGELTRCVVIDNAAPIVGITSPEAKSVAIGKVVVTGSVLDKNLAQVGAYVDGKQVIGWCDDKAAKGSPSACDTCKKQFSDCLSRQGDFSFTIDRADQPTANLLISVAAVDKLGTQVVVNVPVKVLKAPRFEVARTDVDDLTGKIHDLHTRDIDGDGVVDALVASDKGVFLRRGRNVGSEAKAKGDGTFLPAEPLLPPGGLPCGPITAVDIDLDGVMDHVVLRRLEESTELHAFLSRKGGVRLLETVTIKGLGIAMTTGDIDGDGVGDVVIGGQEDQNALTVQHLLKVAICPGKDKPDRPCKEATDIASIAGGKVFGARQVSALAGGVSAVRVADFIDIGASKGWLDIAIGRFDKPVLSVCRNDNGKVLGCLDTPNTSWVADMSDTRHVVHTDWNGDGAPDLIVASAGKGIIRWIAGKGDGTFAYDAGAYREFHTDTVDAIEVHPLGPSGEDYLAVLANGRTVTLIPIDPKDDAHRRKCFRTFVLGGSISSLAPADLDNDGSIDLVGADGAPYGVAVALGTGDGNFRAAVVHRVCGSREEDVMFFSSLEVSHFLLEDFTADGRPDLMLVSKPASSFVKFCKKDKGVPSPIPAWHVHLYANLGKALDEFARAGEISPYQTQAGAQQAGIIDEIIFAGCGRKMPEITGFQGGEFGGGSGRDLAMAVATEYTVGAEPEEGVPVDPTAPNIDCLWREYYEVVNFFGIESPDDVQPGSSKACKIYNDEDEKKEKPLIGYGQGAPWDRASLLIYLAGNPQEPFGLSPGGTPGKPNEIRPFYAQAGGRKPVGMVVGRFDEDGFDDIATVMKRDGSDTETSYLHDRVRLFKSDGQGRLRAVLFADASKNEAQQINKDFNVDSGAIEFVTVASAEQKDFWRLMDPDVDKIAAKVFVTYRTLGHQPKAVVGASFCSDNLRSIFTIGAESGNVGVIRALGGMKLSHDSKNFSLGTDLVAFAVKPFDSDDCNDVVYAKKSALGFYRGTSDWYDVNQPFWKIDETEVSAIDTADVNKDELLDLLVVDSTRSSVEIFLGDGEGGFHRVQDPLLAMGIAGRMAKADIDGDGCNEIAVQGTFGVAVFKNIGCK